MTVLNDLIQHVRACMLYLTKIVKSSNDFKNDVLIHANDRTNKIEMVTKLGSVTKSL